MIVKSLVNAPSFPTYILRGGSVRRLDGALDGSLPFATLFRFITTGNAAPRESAYHNRTESSWKSDTREQFTQVVILDNPDSFDTLCVHLYPRKGLFAGQLPDARTFCEALLAISMKTRKPVLIGEFGAPATLGPEEEKRAFLDLLTTIEKTGIPLSALWVYDHAGQDEDWNITFANDRAYMLRQIALANRRLQGTAEPGGK